MDPYLDQGLGSSLDPGRRRTAKAVYWNIRRYARSVRAFITDHYKKNPQMQRELYLLAEGIDLVVAKAWAQGGTTMIDVELDNNDLLEHNLSKISAETTFAITGDTRMRDEMTTCRTPGAAHVAPEGELARARDMSKALYQQAQRTSGRGGGGGGDQSDDGAPKRARRRNRRGRGQQAQDGGGDGGKGGGGKGAAAQRGN